MDSNGLQKVVDLGLNVSKVAANLSETAKRDKSPKQENHPQKETTNQPHNQTVEVKVGGDLGNPNQQPKIVKEKSETHIHKHFPDNRELSEKECELEKYRLELEYKDKQAERDYRMIIENNRRREQKERDEYAHKQEELRRERQAKSSKTRKIIGGILFGLGVGLAGYSVYSDIRSNRSAGLALPTQEKAAPKKLIKAEGTVK